MSRGGRHALICIAVAAVCLVGSAVRLAVGDPPPAVIEQEQIIFLKRHWQSPIAPQGKPPARFSALEASLDPESCGVCHRPQYDDWKTSVHRKSMGPGVIGQTMETIQNDPGAALRCYSCHAPLAEQQEKLRGRSGPRARFKKNPAFLASLQAKGLSCAGCHVRSRRFYGPPKRDGSLENFPSAFRLPHDGAIRTAAFERSEFCKGCHQFEPDGYALNGKLLENTYNEWKEGPFGRAGRACQTCHMPDRRHLWRGIHDPEMVRQGVTVHLTLDRERYQVGDRLQAVIVLANTGVGHYFPTYVTPKVLVRFELRDSVGRSVEGSLEETRIGREVTLDLTKELFDTRIPPGEIKAVPYARTIEQPGLTLKASVVVVPDDFYVKFFDSIALKAKTKRAMTLLQQALDEARRSSFILFEKEVGVS